MTSACCACTRIKAPPSRIACSSLRAPGRRGHRDERVPRRSVIAIRARRRFKTGDTTVVEVVRLLEVPALPPHSFLVEFADGTGAAGVAAMRMTAYPSPRAPGLYPISIESIFGAEPPERLPSVLEAGWTRIESVMP